jgi:flagella basal body P-ring formation protein FlgA
MNTLYKYIVVVLLLLSWPALAAEEKAKLFTLSYAQAEEAVSAALADKGVAEKVAAFINGRQKDDFYSYSKPLTVETRGLQFDKTSGRWSANLLMLSAGEVVTALPASGRFDVLAEIPVLKRVVKNGQLIEAADVEIRDIAVSQVRSDTVTDMASLIGKSPAYSVSPGRPIRTHEISAPPMIKKNSLVQMHYRSPGMEITTSGQAMEDGAKGDIINVKNIASKKIIQTVVEDTASVSVSSPAEQRVQIDGKPSVGDLYATN